LSLSKISFILTAGFPAWSLVVSAIALYQPASFLWYGGDAITWGLGVIMLGMGVTLEPKDFTQVFKSPKIIILGVSLQFLIMPAWSALLAWGFGLSPELAVGLILVACCPGGTASNVVVFLAKARVALSVSLTLCSTVIAVLLTPWLTYVYAGHYIPIEPWALLKSILWIVLFPLALGIFMKGFFPGPVKKVSEFSPVLSVLFILLIVGYILASKRDTILENGWILLLATGLLHMGGFFLGYMGAIWFGRSSVESQTLSIEVGMQNSGLGAALATKHFPSMPLAPAPCAMSAILHCLIGSVLASKWARENIKGGDSDERSV
jgi:BASS family bile acid:Na+ symporter